MMLWTAFEVASHQSRFEAVCESRARLNFRWFLMSFLSPETDVSSPDVNCADSDIRGSCVWPSPRKNKEKQGSRPQLLSLSHFLPPPPLPWEEHPPAPTMRP